MKEFKPLTTLNTRKMFCKKTFSVFSVYSVVIDGVCNE